MAWWREVRWASGQQFCVGCNRVFDGEEYTRTLMPSGTQHRRPLNPLIECRDCRPIH